MGSNTGVENSYHVKRLKITGRPALAFIDQILPAVDLASCFSD
jgi:hypothetical protein